MDLVLPAFAVPTGETPKEGPITQEDDLRRILKVSEFDIRPVLLYFHYPHEDDEKLTPEGKLSKKQCAQLVDEQVARWALLFRSYEVDMAKSDRKAAERLGAAAGTSYSVVDGKLAVIAKTGPMASSKATAQFLESALRDGAPALWADVQKRLEEQKAILDEARKLAAKKEWKAAQEKYDLVVRSDLRIGDWWDDAAKEADRVAQKAAQEK